jgi:hypothetical protein
MNVARPSRTARYRFARHRAAVAATRRRAADRDAGADLRGDGPVPLGDGADSDDIASTTSCGCVWCDLDLPTRDTPDGGCRVHVLSAEPIPGAADTYVCTATDATPSWHLLDQHAAWKRVHAADAPAADRDADPALSSDAWGALYWFGRACDLVDGDADDGALR